jgi:hypothetical protein
MHVRVTFQGPRLRICRYQRPSGLKARVCGPSLAGVTGLNLAGGMVVCVACCQ